MNPNTLTREDMHLVEQLQLLSEVPVTQNTYKQPKALEICHITPPNYKNRLKHHFAS